ncbi:LD-carboxypeptidase [Sesbania bispinosa]|nr:LD-carboxypeptidase [Sesbania bispinosa]
MTSFYAFLRFQPFCPANLPAIWPIGLPSFLVGRRSSLLATSTCYVFYASKEAGKAIGLGRLEGRLDKKAGRLADKEDERSADQEG